MSRIALIGKPNCGKSLLFNQLTKLGQKVANYPGVTVEISSGQFNNHTVIDFPGIYSLETISEDERVAVEKFETEIQSEKLSGIIVVLDGTRLQTSLLLGLQIAERVQNKIPILFAINFLDTLKENQLHIDTVGLSEKLGLDVVLFSAKTTEGLNAIKDWIAAPIAKDANVTDTNLESYAHALTESYSADTTPLLNQQHILDNIFLSGMGGSAFLILTLLMLFQSVFTWSGPLMDGVEFLIVSSGEWVTGRMTEGVLQSFIGDALFGGFGSFLVFVPQIFVLTFLISLLEDSGYMARMAVMCHRPLQWFGLSGKSVVPLLSGHACAIPAIYAARTIESPKRRLLTMMVVPLTSCSARLPVYALLVAVAIPDTILLGGLFGMRGLAFFVLYFMGIAGSLIVSALIAKFSLKDKDDTPFMLELPAYRVPQLTLLIKRAWHSAVRFLKGAGPMIFSVNAIIWVLGYFPNGGTSLEHSYLGTIGQTLEPMFAPLGLDWKFTVAILMSFLAREVFVGALGTMMGLEDKGDGSMEEGLVERLQAAELPLGTSIGLLVFYVFAMQCVSTLAVLKQEIGNIKTPVLIFMGYNLLAYVLALVCVWTIG